MAVIVRALAKQDFDSVLEIEASSPEAAQWSQNDYSSLLRAGSQGWIAAEQGHILGFVFMRRVADEVEILNIAVAPAFRRKGVGSLLLREVLSWAKENWVANLHLEVRASNPAARKFYEAHGFRQVGCRPNYYSDPRDDAILLNRLVAEK
ncbi:MAG TPA: ribosomal protein S18-alanine N-acetyltransferase [Candidatus Acidoferrales bacterium]|nr:ribosomal protein S18-alanine N-acetyltransferase [Candidatus Acidoferrales bacterium]